MKLQELRNALTTNDALSIKSGEVRIGPDSLEVTFPAGILAPFHGETGIEITNASVVPESGLDKVIIKGTASFSLLKEPAEVLATFELVGNEEDQTLGVTLRYKLPLGWRFLKSFPDLPRRFDSLSQRYDYDSQKSDLDSTFTPTDGYFYLTTHQHKLEDDRYKQENGSYVLLEEGLNVVGQWAPSGVLGFAAHLARGEAGGLVIHGQVVPGVAPLPTLAPDQFPWDASPRVPGIHLEVPLNAELAFPPGSDTIKFTNLRYETYSPLSQYWLLDYPSYAPVTAYLGDLVIPAVRDTRLLTVSARVSPGGDDDLVFACQFVEIDIDNLLKASEAMAGGQDLRSLLPDGIQDAIGKLGPQNASITFVRPAPKAEYEVACTQLTIGMGKGAKPWALFGGLLEIEFESARIAAVLPFDSQQRAVFSTFKGAVKFLGVKLDVQVEAPSLYLSAQQVGTTTFNLKGYFEDKAKTPWPRFLPDRVEVANMTLLADPGAYYAFSMSLGAAFKIKDRGKEYSLPTLRLAVSYHQSEVEESYIGWQFQASTKDGETAVPAFVLIEKLAEGVGLEISLPDAVKDIISVNSALISYNTRNQHTAFECWGKLNLFNKIAADCTFTIQHTPAKLDPPEAKSTTSFGGQVLLTPEQGSPPLSFGLHLSTVGDSTCCLATYSDGSGRSLKVKSLAECVLPPSLANLVPPSLEVRLKSALLAYNREGEPPTEGAAAKSAVLFAVDLGARIDLSDLPVIGSALPKDLTIGLDSLRILVASARFSRQSVLELNGLLPPGVKPLPSAHGGDGPNAKPSTEDALTRGFHVSAALLFGKEPRTLTLPALAGPQEAADNPAETPAPGAPGGQLPAETDGATKWFDIEKSLGPVTVQRIGLTYEAAREAVPAEKLDERKARVGIKFDASLQLSALTFSLQGLGLLYALGGSIEPSEILANLEFTLDGMGLALGNGPIEIGGSLVRVPRADHQLELEGTLLVRTAPFTFSAMGSYVDVSGAISVMAFAVLLAELGDPTGTGAFVVTGLAFGFGVNRKLRLPPIEEVEKFPLVQAAMGKQDFQSLSKLPATLRDFVAPAAGNFWIAAGIKFNSFVMVDSFLLVSVSWGAEVEIGLLGLSRMTVPPLQPDPEKVIAGAELALRGVVRIAEGLIQFEARLTENSFIFSKACRLTGGFAFCVWFAGPHAGDFVVSLGGYHPAFARPAHYPLVPRLGMQLQIGAELSITGEAYFTLTPSCIMAGGKLCAVFKSGGIEAWFIAYADFLMSWQPFYYQAAMGITLGIALRLGALAIRLELSVELKLQGPPFGGEARVVLWILSFTIPFGAPAAAPLPLKPGEFIKNCLPAPKGPQKDNSPDVFSVRITQGLLREQKVGANHTHRLVNAHQLSLVAQSVIPCTEFEGLAATLKAVAPCGIRPMGKTSLQSVFTVTADGIEPGKHVKVSAILGNVPDALWGKSEQEGLVPLPRTPQSKTIQATLGIRIACIPQQPVHGLPAMPIEKFLFERLPLKTVDWTIMERPKYVKPQQKWTNYSAIWTDDSVRERRDDVLACLRQQLPSNLVLNQANLEKLSRTSDYFQAQPEMNAVGY